MMMLLALTPMRMLYAFDVVAYAVVDDANTDAKMPNDVSPSCRCI